jgi:hypothetical protein
MAPNATVTLGEPDSIITTYHLPLHLKMVKSTTQNLGHHSQNLVSNHTYKVTSYITNVYSHLKRTKLFQKIDSLTPETISSQELNTIDKLFVSIRLRAEAKLKRQHLDWVPQRKKELQDCSTKLRKLKEGQQNSQCEIIQPLNTKHQLVKKFKEHTTLSFQITKFCNTKYQS